MTTLIEQVRFDVEWAHRHAEPPVNADTFINTLTPLGLLELISAALEGHKPEDKQS